MSNPHSQYLDAVAKAETLKPLAIEYLNKRKTELEQEIAELDSRISAMTSEQKPKAERVKGPTYTGKQISFRLLAELLKERPDRTSSLRKEGYDTKWMKKLVQENPGQLQLGGAGPWPTVTLVS